MSLLHESLLLLWICLSTLYYGYHISELNFTQPSLTCSTPTSLTSSPVLLGLPNCLGLTEPLYSLATAMFTIGGLLGSVYSSRVIARRGMIGAIKVSGMLNLAAALLMGLAPHWTLLVLGRLFSGFAAGLGICVVPPLLAIIARTSPTPYISSHAGSIGILSQVALTSGIFLGQVMGLVGTGMKGDFEGGWRWVVLASGAVSALHIGAVPVAATA